MANSIGIRAEEKHWESRVTISPEDIQRLPNRLHFNIQNEGRRALPYKNRVFSNDEYLEASKAGGATVSFVDSLKDCKVIIGTKEIKEVFTQLPKDLSPTDRELAKTIEQRFPPLVVHFDSGFVHLNEFLFKNEKQQMMVAAQGSQLEDVLQELLRKQEDLIEEGTVYVFFSHTHKGQIHNMRMLHELVKKRCTLIDYELLRETITGRSKRAVSYGSWAGIVGVLDSLWAYGEHLHLRTGSDCPFRKLRSEACYDADKYEYISIEHAKATVYQISQEIERGGLVEPVVIGVTGYRGEVGHSVIDVLTNWGLPCVEINADDFVNGDFRTRFEFSRHKVYHVKLDYAHLYRSRINPDASGDAIRSTIKSGRGHTLESNVDKYFIDLSILINCIVWNPKSPRLLTNAFLKQVYEAEKGMDRLLPVIGDISCDPNGSVQCCRDTYPNHPVYMWVPERSEEPILADFDLKSARGHSPIFDLNQYGFVLMAITNLPCEIPRDASLQFSRDFCKKRPELNGVSYLECLAQADFDADFNQCNLPQAVKDAIILFQGKFNGCNDQILFKAICLSLIEIDAIRVDQVLPMLGNYRPKTDIC